jgi:hypothetical protein
MGIEPERMNRLSARLACLFANADNWKCVHADYLQGRSPNDRCRQRQATQEADCEAEQRRGRCIKNGERSPPARVTAQCRKTGTSTDTKDFFLWL